MLILPDGRDLAYAEYEPPNGTPIVFFAGFGRADEDSRSALHRYAAG